ncbi:hypothetical protein D3C78_1647450 [compost metagenome]
MEILCCMEKNSCTGAQMENAAPSIAASLKLPKWELATTKNIEGALKKTLAKNTKTKLII